MAEIFAPKVKPKTTKGTASTTQKIMVKTTSLVYTSPPRYCQCDPVSTAPKDFRRPVHCRLCGSKLKEVVKEDYHCLMCGKIRLKTVKRCPKASWWRELLGIYHTVSW